MINIVEFKLNFRESYFLCVNWLIFFFMNLIHFKLIFHSLCHSNIFNSTPYSDYLNLPFCDLILIKVKKSNFLLQTVRIFVSFGNHYH